MIVALLLLALGILLSAFFSGAETGFYRVTRVRLLIDALGGDRIARCLLWTANHPLVFVATLLVGNNLANYMVSLAVVMGIQQMFVGGSQSAELIGPLALAPVVFIYGELLPKHMFYQAPNRLLRRCGPFLLAASVLFAPVTAVLWVVNRLLQLVVGGSQPEIRLTLARRELAQVLAEGHEVGILKPAQQALVQGIFSLAGEPVGKFAVPAGRYGHINPSMSSSEVFWIARRQRRALLPVEEPSGKRPLLGYIRVADLAVRDQDELPDPRPFVELDADETFLSAMTRLLAANYALGRVVSSDGHTVGFVTAKQLGDALLSGRK